DDGVAVADAQVSGEIGELVLEELDGPEVGRSVRKVRAPAATELVVEDAAATGAREVGDRLRVVVGGARAAVADHDRQRPPVEVAEDAVPGLVPVPDHPAFGHLVSPFASSGWWHAARRPPPWSARGGRSAAQISVA